MVGAQALKSGGGRRTLLSGVTSALLLSICLGIPAAYVFLSSGHVKTAEYEAASRVSLSRGLLSAGANAPSEAPVLTVTPLQSTQPVAQKSNCAVPNPNPCYASDGLSSVCCPGSCGDPPGDTAWCQGQVNPNLAQPKATPTPSKAAPKINAALLGAIPQVVTTAAVVGSSPAASPIGAVTPNTPVTLAPAAASSPAMCLDSSNNPIGAGNLIANPGFANGQLPTGWSFFGPASVSVSTDDTFVMATGRQMTYAGPSWEIDPDQISPGGSYTGLVWIQLSNGSSEVDLTLLVITNGDHNYLRVGSVVASSGCWEQLGGIIDVPGGADQLILYVEGPPPGTDLYVRTAALFPTGEVPFAQGPASPPGLLCIGSSRYAIAGKNFLDDSKAQVGWTCAGCLFNYSSDHSYTIATARAATFDGPTWSLSGKLSVGQLNSVQVWVQLGNQVNSAPVKLTAKTSVASQLNYTTLATGIAYAGCWTQLAGNYTLPSPVDQIAVYVEGPDLGVDEWVASPAVFVPGLYPVPVPGLPKNTCSGFDSTPLPGTNLIYSPGFYGGAPGGWGCFGCTLSVIAPAQNYITASDRQGTWQGPSWMLTGKIGQGSTYALQVMVRVDSKASPVQLTMHTSLNGQADQYTPIAIGTAQTDCWIELNGTFTLSTTVDSIVMYVEGPPVGVNIEVMTAAAVLTIPASTIRPLPNNVCPDSLNVPPPVNSIVENPGFANGLPATWVPFGSCNLGISADQQYVIASNRQQDFAGPSWDITKFVAQGNLYRFSAWISTPPSVPTTRITYGVAVTVAGVTNYYCGGQNNITGGCWSQLNGGYNMYQATPDKVVIYLQGAAPGVDIWVQSVNVEPITRESWLEDVTIRTDQLRKANVIVNVQDENGNPVPNAQVHIDQTRQGFPFGVAVNYQLPANPAYQQFVKERYNWVVFENEAKWYFNEPVQGQYNYATTDAMVAWAEANDIQIRGHNVFWEDAQVQQPWIRNLPDNNALQAAMSIRLDQVVDRYKGEFEHWDVDNEALHNSYYSSRFGPEIQSWMYANTQARDPAVQMFINEFNVIEECDGAANPTTFIAQAQGLEAQGFQISFGCQAHFANPVQNYKLRADLDKLASFGRPIWITEMDFAEPDENKKADFLEFAYREFFAHPAVEGILMWTVWEGPFQCDWCTFNGDFSPKPSGVRQDQLLLNEWRTTNVTGQTDASGKPFIFRGFYGDYTATITVNGATYTDLFTVLKEENGNSVTLTIPINGSGSRRKLLSSKLHRRSALTDPERKLPSSYVSGSVPGDELGEKQNSWSEIPVHKNRAILSRQALDAAETEVRNEGDGYAVIGAQLLEIMRSQQRSLLESEERLTRPSVESAISRQDYDAASFRNRELLAVKEQTHKVKEAQPKHAFLELGKGFDYVRLEVEQTPGYQVPKPNHSGSVNSHQRRLLEVEEAEIEKNEYLDTIMYYGGEQANSTEALVAHLRRVKVASRMRRNRQRMLRYGPFAR